MTMKPLIILLFLCLTSQAHAVRLKCNYKRFEMGSSEELSVFIGKLKKVRTGKQLARYVNFPLNVNIKPKKLVIKNTKGLTKHYKKIMSEKVRSYIYYTDTKKVFCNNEGLMLGKGQVWLRRFKNQYKITALNP